MITLEIVRAYLPEDADPDLRFGSMEFVDEFDRDDYLAVLAARDDIELVKDRYFRVTLIKFLRPRDDTAF